MKPDNVVYLPSFDAFWQFIRFLIVHDYSIKEDILRIFKKFSVKGLSEFIDKPLLRFKVMKILQHRYGAVINEPV